MHFAFTEDQVAITEAARGMLAESCTPADLRRLLATDEPLDGARWATVCDMGLLGICAPEDRGGLGLGLIDLIGIAEAGMAIGGKGADLAGEALTGVVGAIFGGKEGEKAFEQRMEEQGKKIEAEAMKLCTQLPGLLASQQALAASLPAFKPYARMTQEDIDDCGKDVKGKGVAVTSS